MAWIIIKLTEICYSNQLFDSFIMPHAHMVNSQAAYMYYWWTSEFKLFIIPSLKTEYISFSYFCLGFWSCFFCGRFFYSLQRDKELRTLFSCFFFFFSFSSIPPFFILKMVLGRLCDLYSCLSLFVKRLICRLFLWVF